MRLAPSPAPSTGTLISSSTCGPHSKRGGPTLRLALRGASNQPCGGQWPLAGCGPSTTLRGAARLGWAGGRVSFSQTPLGGGSLLARRVTGVHVVLGARPLSVGGLAVCTSLLCQFPQPLLEVCVGGGPTNPAVLTFCEVDGPGIQIPRLCVGVGSPLEPQGPQCSRAHSEWFAGQPRRSSSAL